MKTEKFRYLAGVIATHTDRKVVGRTRLQKTIKLLQRMGLPTDYDFRLFFYGPYSEGLKSDLGLLEVLCLVKEEERHTADGTPYYIIQADPRAELAELEAFKKHIRCMEAEETVVLELAATYDSFREMDSDHAEALNRLRRKKGEKCRPENMRQAFALLKKLQLPNN